jgi:hypothetical protein
MKYAKMLGLGLLTLTLAFVAGCPQASTPKGNVPAKDTAAKADSGKKEEHAPHGKGPNGGVVFDLGKYHAEFTVDHDKKECTILVLDDDEKTVAKVASKEMTVITKESKTKDGTVVPPMTIKMLPKDEADGKASKFVGTDPGLGSVADFEGSVVTEINGKPSRGKFKE